jgi:hypothetical protein
MSNFRSTTSWDPFEDFQREFPVVYQRLSRNHQSHREDENRSRWLLRFFWGEDGGATCLSEWKPRKTLSLVITVARLIGSDGIYYSARQNAWDVHPHLSRRMQSCMVHLNSVGNIMIRVSASHVPHSWSSFPQSNGDSCFRSREANIDSK